MDHHVTVPADYAPEKTPPANSLSSDAPVLGSEEVPIAAAPEPAKKVRVVCLDVFRGLTIFTMIFVNLGGGGLEPFNHVDWNGLRPADCVFPCFAWIMGVTMNIGMASHAKKGTAPWKILLDSFIRSIKLFLLGLFVNNYQNLKTGRITGVLQSFGFAFFTVTLAIVLGLYCKSESRPWQHRAVEGFFMAAIVATNLLLTFCLPVPDCPTGYLGADIDGCGGGAHFYIDVKIFTKEHMYRGGDQNDPEGFLNWLMVAFIAYIGYVVGGFFLNAKAWTTKTAILGGSGVVIGLVGLGLAGFQIDDGPIPINKKMWSLSFVLAVSGLANVILGLLYVVVDKVGFWKGTPFMQAGMNAIALYVGHEVMGEHVPFGWDRDGGSKTQNTLSNLGGAICWVIIAVWMHKKKIFITV
ncbi:Aste57867_8259 [Aphanomyces stellatus]|uniref:Aste57867_8259 protein n=1 Tax=Aphanomyces stellatus TaxID=120398 RepID=A0A485KJU8_9STRA|nr:hypothetical protein As57867_008228 [Aphanomyces stellatus]VFT85146.1 Aste57867_8259 [Aphanomyces stellatus]